MNLDEQLREAGERWRASERAPVADFRRATATPHRGARTLDEYRGLFAVPIIVGAFLLAIGVARIFQDSSSKAKVTVTQPTVPRTTAPKPPSVLLLGPELGQVSAVAFDDAGAWVTGYALRPGPATLEHIDTQTGRVLSKVELPGYSSRIVVGDGALWISGAEQNGSPHVIKVDSNTGKVTAVIPLPGDATIAVTTDAVWLYVNTGTLLRLDPDTNEVVATIALPGAPVTDRAHLVTAGPLGVFLTNGGDGTVLRVDPATNTAKELVDVGESAGALAEFDGSLWVGAESSVAEIDPITGAVLQRIPGFVHALVSDGRFLWGTTFEDLTKRATVRRIDPRTGRAVSVLLPVYAKFSPDIAVDPTTGAVWVALSQPPADEQPERLLRLAP